MGRIGGMSKLLEPVVCEQISDHLCGMRTCIIDMNHQLFLIKLPSPRKEMISLRHEISIYEPSRAERCPCRENCHDLESVRISKHCRHMFLPRNCPIRIIRGLVKRGDPQAIPNVFKIKPALVAGHNITLLIVLLHSQCRQHRLTHLDANECKAKSGE
jgi:hypothetical protein